MSSSELRYLIAANELAEELQCVKQTDLANKLSVTKVSAYNAVERLKEKGYIEKNERKIVLVDSCRCTVLQVNMPVQALHIDDIYVITVFVEERVQSLR